MGTNAYLFEFNSIAEPRYRTWSLVCLILWENQEVWYYFGSKGVDVEKTLQSKSLIGSHWTKYLNLLWVHGFLSMILIIFWPKVRRNYWLRNRFTWQGKYPRKVLTKLKQMWNGEKTSQKATVKHFPIISSNHYPTSVLRVIPTLALNLSELRRDFGSVQRNVRSFPNNWKSR